MAGLRFGRTALVYCCRWRTDSVGPSRSAPMVEDLPDRIIREIRERAHDARGAYEEFQPLEERSELPGGGVGLRAA